MLSLILNSPIDNDAEDTGNGSNETNLDDVKIEELYMPLNLPWKIIIPIFIFYGLILIICCKSRGRIIQTLSRILPDF